MVNPTLDSTQGNVARLVQTLDSICVHHLAIEMDKISNTQYAEKTLPAYEDARAHLRWLEPSLRQPYIPSWVAEADKRIWQYIRPESMADTLRFFVTMDTRKRDDITEKAMRLRLVLQVVLRD